MDLEEQLDYQIQEFLDKLKKVEDLDYDLIKLAVEFGKEAHKNQTRKKGDLFFNHPIRVATRALDYHLDAPPIIACLLHDVIEDTKFGADVIKKQFGQTVADFVEALTKVRDSKESTLYKIFALGNVDFRVILLKLLDRLDNLQDLEYLSRKKQRRICQETTGVFVEIAIELGLTDIEYELKNLVFKKMYPNTYWKFRADLDKFYEERHIAIQEILKSIEACVTDQLVENLYPKYLEVGTFLFNRHDITKVLDSIMIETQTPQKCYEVLGYLHTTFRSIPLTIRDYISNPKANGWRGLTTEVIINGERIPINIVTKEFHQKNRYGILTLINEGTYQSEDYKHCLQLFIEVASDSVRIEDVFRYRKSNAIQVFTPMGKVIELRYGASILDFAFAVHTDLGLICNGGIINGVRYPREKILTEGMQIQVLKSENAKPNKSWLKNVVMPKARKELLKYFSKTETKKIS
ncbi:MAG: bifunctional (p)ppGpp synthetase/guanosine-3',5'-bis(diphosphate) 3'-pyrophosphohydrolase [Deltaproteobacteria bacterium]|jgi:GTP diphosphokinase / guanosine-3',5'-bis(diphosphate) 3'-diphosphatase|nr:bifunctional (p)ppGpp synthetase/guanosine-3',5'-bis(diphosphate) 3'-pyrophosphohydrolase [Deltaproteobacteria bacterium]